MSKISAYPYRAFRYQVEMDGTEVGAFSEVSGLNRTVTAIDYREGSDLRNVPRKLPGLTHFGNVSLRKGVTGDEYFQEWMFSVGASNKEGPTGLERKTIKITLFDDAGNQGPSWEFINCWPIAYNVSDMNGLGEEVLVESLEFCHEGLEFTSGNAAGTASTI